MKIAEINRGLNNYFASLALCVVAVFETSIDVDFCGGFCFATLRNAFPNFFGIAKGLFDIAQPFQPHTAV
ncbi:hypothetical protein L0337_00955, partial [candidate division KSB1 bacterium]|nr:hypothetical protein [candidate division KSB1 bacterium]